MVKILNLPPPNLVWDGRDSYPALPYTIFKKVFCRNGGYEHLLGKTSTLRGIDEKSGITLEERFGELQLWE